MCLKKRNHLLMLKRVFGSWQFECVCDCTLLVGWFATIVIASIMLWNGTDGLWWNVNMGMSVFLLFLFFAKIAK